MIIGIDACCWSNRRGFGRFTRELVTELVASDPTTEFILFADAETAASADFPKGARIEVAPTTVAPTTAASATGRRSVRDMWTLTRTVASCDLDVFFFPAVYSFFPILNRTRILVTIHDVIADRHPRETFERRKFEYFWKLKQRLAIFQATRLLTVSNYSREMICDYFNLPRSMVDVTTEGPSSVFTPASGVPPRTDILESYGVDPRSPFVIHVGGFSPHKNLPRLVSALADLRRTSNRDVRLVLVGDHENDSFFTDVDRVRRQARESGVQDQIVFTGFVPDEHLVHLYRAAEALVFPSLEEGFGLPAIEAMACGIPVIASERGSLPEIAGECGRYFDPTDLNDMRTAIQDVLENEELRRRLGRSALERSNRFSWKAAARSTRDILHSLPS
jgi:glycosyltransferase involved in cell wall biosynthesis